MVYTKQHILGLLLIVFISTSTSCSRLAGEEASNSEAVDVVMLDHAFAVVDSISSGWNMFAMTNKGEETHEFVLHRLPDGKSYKDMMTQVVQPLDSLEQLLLEGKIDSAGLQKATRENLPKWVGKLEMYGGGGLITPGQTAHTTFNLDPGQYVMSCFIPSANGRSHIHQGMVRSIHVSKNDSVISSPKADVEITSSGDEITVDGSFGFGKQTVLFTVEEPPSEKSAPYTTIFLAQLTDPLIQKEDLRGDVNANPPPADFLGGALGVPAGDTSYVTVELTVPGHYTWVLPHEEKKTKFKEFVVK